MRGAQSRRLAVCALALWSALSDCAAEVAPGFLDLYRENRARGIPNYITEDFLLLAYGLIRAATWTETEEKQALPLLRATLSELRKTAGRPSPGDRISAANRDFLAVLEALLQGQSQPRGPSNSKRAASELDQVLRAQGIAASPLWGMQLDYSQFRPRGHYTERPDLERYFRAVRYASTVLFAFQDSRSTGVTAELANRLAGQALRLAQALGDSHERLEALFTWSVGPADDLRREDLLAASRGATGPDALRRALLDYARVHDRQPRILGGVVDASKLESNLTARDVLTGWRLLAQRYTPEAAAFQHLIYDRVKDYRGDCPECPPPFGLALIGGKPVKGFPMAHELMALLGSPLAKKTLESARETAFEGYAEGYAAAAEELGRADGLAAEQLRLMRAWLMDGTARADESRRLNSMLGFWTWQRYLGVLYAKQSYTLGGKGLALDQARAGAWLEPAVSLYTEVKRLVDAHCEHTPHPSWDRFAGLLDQVRQIAERELQETALSAEDEAFLNDLDRSLAELAGRMDGPIVVDVHTNPASGEVVEEALGYPRVIERDRPGSGKARGALFSHCEFKQPLAQRLTDEAWKRRLEAGDMPPGCGVSARQAATR